MLSVQMSCKDTTPAGSVHKSRGDRVVCQCVQLNMCCVLVCAVEHCCVVVFLFSRVDSMVKWVDIVYVLFEDG